MDFYFNGVWGKMREDFLRNNQPEIYQSLKDSGELFAYLQDFQDIYSQRADLLTKKLQKRYGVDKNFEKNDSIGWLADSAKIFLAVRQKLKAEIEK